MYGNSGQEIVTCILKAGEGLTRAELARQLCISATTVGKQADRLILEGILTQTSRKSSVGEKGRALYIRKDISHFVIELEADHVEIFSLSAYGERSVRYSRPINPSLEWEDNMRGILMYALQMQEKHRGELGILLSECCPWQMSEVKKLLPTAIGLHTEIARKRELCAAYTAKRYPGENILFLLSGESQPAFLVSEGREQKLLSPDFLTLEGTEKNSDLVSRLLLLFRVLKIDRVLADFPFSPFLKEINRMADGAPLPVWEECKPSVLAEKEMAERLTVKMVRRFRKICG